jgi:outer membrane receptor protein involved in Fe transport
LTENDVLSITAYYKDIFDYITPQTVQVPQTKYSSGTYTTYINLDYARNRGVEVEYIKRFSDWFRGDFSLSYSIATGKSSSAEEALYNIQQGLSDNVKEFYVAWDRPFEATATLNFHVNKNKALFGFGNGILDDYNIYTRFFYESGKRYTPQILIGYDATTGRPTYLSDANNSYGAVGDDIMTVDLNFEKTIDFSFVKVVISVEISNLLNRENAQIINPVTGSAYTLGQSTPNNWNDPRYPELQAPVDPYPFNPARYMEPRHIILGVAVRF